MSPYIKSASQNVHRSINPAQVFVFADNFAQMNRYYVYITTNRNRTVFYIGVTNSLNKRISQHHDDALLHGKHFTGKYQSFYLLYFEEFTDALAAIRREKEIKKWRREKKLKLIRSQNPEMKFLELV